MASKRQSDLFLQPSDPQCTPTSTVGFSAKIGSMPVNERVEREIKPCRRFGLKHGVLDSASTRSSGVMIRQIRYAARSEHVEPTALLGTCHSVARFTKKLAKSQRGRIAWRRPVQ